MPAEIACFLQDHQETDRKRPQKVGRCQKKSTPLKMNATLASAGA
jgi:hypothetical protein